MAIQLRLPNITATTEREQLIQLKSYLYQLTEQLQIALDEVGSPSSVQPQTNVSAKGSSSITSKDAAVAFSALKPLIIKSADIVNAYYQKISNRLEGQYVAHSDFGVFQ
jgi:hypothetical protein